MLIARRADTRARADFATWKMMAKLNGLSALPPDAQGFLASYKDLLEQMSEAEATETTIAAVYKAYYAEMGGAGTAPEVPPRAAPPVSDNVTVFRRPAPKPKKTAPFGAAAYSGTQKRPLPVALIFACLIVVYVAIRYYWR
ncbi:MULTISPECIES: hypothetical protein [unclassified Bradyrhizobium]|uniref:hypothetical protein n=1 Tax=unclassified Bradyrhizobium TaxID=2631580 RepID=UPI0024792A90|nr:MULTISPECIES: hypothetical protein [unclassified Bradyrhizobium]WGR75168.1 hypothetical protein MTX24_23840 [Bradyrhizobium sp. ISRA426]WGR82670.1 hypothetical protein MTX21_08955 [Bradyrhizobium sp. ISRA430]WGR90367.1 hypothetical protein MTX25_23520 [Bradyrhizobium sp. ISRA432]